MVSWMDCGFACCCRWIFGVSTTRNVAWVEGVSRFLRCSCADCPLGTPDAGAVLSYCTAEFVGYADKGTIVPTVSPSHP